MKEYKCPNCGAPINMATMKCEYCGATFGHDDSLIIYQLEHPKIMPFQTITKIDREFARIDGYEKFIMDEVARSLADKIAKYMEVQVQDDPMNNQVAICGRVRIVPPNVRF